MMTNDKRDDTGLEAYFAAGRKAGRVPSNDLLGRIMADAEMQMPVSESSVPVSRPSFRAAFWSAIGGWPAVGGMVTASLVGVWIGFSQPAGLDQIADRYFGSADDSYLVDLLPAFGDDFAKG